MWAIKDSRGFWWGVDGDWTDVESGAWLYTDEEKEDAHIRLEPGEYWVRVEMT